MWQKVFFTRVMPCRAFLFSSYQRKLISQPNRSLLRLVMPCRAFLFSSYEVISWTDKEVQPRSPWVMPCRAFLFSSYLTEHEQTGQPSFM